MQPRTKNIKREAVCGFTATTLLAIFAAGNHSLQKVDSKFTYTALAIAAGTLLVSLYHTPVRNLFISSMAGLFNKSAIAKKITAADMPNDKPADKKLEREPAKQHSRSKSA